MVRQKIAVFSPHIAYKPFKACIFIVASWPVQFFTIGNDVIGGLICLSQEALEGGTMAAQAAHNCCRRYSFLLPGHKPHFLRHWNFFKTSSSIFTKHLVKNCSKKKKGGRHGRLGRPTWTNWLKKEHSMQVWSLLELKKTSLTSKADLLYLCKKLAQIQTIFRRQRDFYNPYFILRHINNSYLF
jgi:hypothetical protein